MNSFFINRFRWYFFEIPMISWSKRVGNRKRGGRLRNFYFLDGYFIRMSSVVCLAFTRKDVKIFIVYQKHRYQGFTPFVFTPLPISSISGMIRKFICGIVKIVSCREWVGVFIQIVIQFFHILTVLPCGPVKRISPPSFNIPSFTFHKVNSKTDIAIAVQKIPGVYHLPPIYSSTSANRHGEK